MTNGLAQNLRMGTQSARLLGLDIGRRRVGLSLADDATGFAQPYATWEQSDNLVDNVAKLAREQHVRAVVAGWPRNLSGDSTAQTDFTAQFIARLERALSVPVYKQDEALSSVRAHEELRSRGKVYNKPEVDALAATYILEDYLTIHPPKVQ
jgi:putative Holliday junction resolvase